jgi:hypothetical protein
MTALTVDQILQMSAEEQATWFKAMIRASHSQEDADWILDPGPEEDDDGPDWREWRQMQDHAAELAEMREIERSEL